MLSLTRINRTRFGEGRGGSQDCGCGMEDHQREYKARLPQQQVVASGHVLTHRDPGTEAANSKTAGCAAVDPGAPGRQGSHV